MKKYQLPGGATLYHAATERDERVFLGAFVRRGALHEDAQSVGAAHLLEHLLFRGTPTYPNFQQLAQTLEEMGGEWNGATSYLNTEIWYVGTLEHLARSHTLLAEMLMAPSLADFAVEKKIVEREISGELNEHGLSTDLCTHMQNIFWPGTRLSTSIAGDRENVSQLTRAQLLQLQKNWYQAPQMSFVVVGGSTADMQKAVQKPLEKLFSTYAAQHLASSVHHEKQLADIIKQHTTAAQPRMVAVPNADDEHQVMIAFPLVHENAEDETHLDLLGKVLGGGFSSRLMTRLREELGLVYDLSCEIVPFGPVSLFTIQASLDDDELEVFLRESWSILQRLVREGPSAQELKRVLNQFLVEQKFLVQDPLALGSRIGWQWVVGESLCSLPAESESVAQGTSTQDIQKLAARLFQRDRTGIVIMGPQAESFLSRGFVL